MNAEEFEERYKKMLDPYVDWCGTFLRRGGAAETVKKWLGMCPDQIKDLGKTDLENLVEARCKLSSQTEEQRRKWFWDRGLRSPVDILSIALVHHLTGYLPALSKEDERAVRGKIEGEIIGVPGESSFLNIVRLRYFKELYQMAPSDRQCAIIYYKLSHDLYAGSEWIPSMALWHETARKEPKGLFDVLSDKPLIHVDKDRACYLARQRIDKCKNLLDCYHFDRDETHQQIADFISSKYQLNPDHVLKMPFKDLEQEISPKDFQSLVGKITARLTAYIGEGIIFREQIWYETRAVYERSLLCHNIFDPDNFRHDWIRDRYYRGKCEYYYDNSDGGCYFNKRHFDYENFIFDLLVLDKIFGVPIKGTVETFLGDSCCWPKLKKEVKAVFGKRLGL